MNYSDKQLRIFEEYENTTNNLTIEAAPGSGKTFTLLELLKRTPKHYKSIFLAFNKSIQTELESKVPEGTDALTLHSLGFRSLLKYTNNKYKLTELKNWIIGKQILDLNGFKDEKKKNIYLFVVSKLVDLYRLNVCKTKQDLLYVADKYNVSYINGEIDDALKIIEYLDKYNRKEYRDKHRPMMIDFVDMIYLPTILLSDDEFYKYDVVMIDEGQDLSDLQWIMIQKLFRKRTRFILVGDKFQSIYSFLGSNVDVFNRIQQYPKTTVLPLSYSYRCPKKVVKEANKVFNFIESPEWKEDGEIVYDGNFDDVKEGDFILCRNNSPLIETFLFLIKKGKRCKILGRDLGNGLLNVLSKIEDFSKESKEELLKNKREQLKEKGVVNITNNASYNELIERIFILEELHKEFQDISVLKSTIEDMFADERNLSASNYVVLSTIHKSKGLESDCVFFLYPDLLPSKYAESELELYSEDCLRYVCITRAKKKLIYIHSIR